MTPLRLVIISILIYILFRLLTGSGKKSGYFKKQAPGSPGDTVQDVLVEDPVCHTYIPKEQAVKLHHDKKLYYFCSNKCCEKFIEQKGAGE